MGKGVETGEKRAVQAGRYGRVAVGVGTVVWRTLGTECEMGSLVEMTMMAWVMRGMGWLKRSAMPGEKEPGQ